MPSDADPRLRLFADRSDLAPDCAALPSGAGFFASAAWWRTMTAEGLSPGETPYFAAFPPEGPCAVLFALMRTGHGTGLAAMTGPYTCLYQPATAPAAGPETLRAAGRALGRLARTVPTLRLDALDGAWSGWQPLLAGVRRAGIVPLHFDHFGNWHEDVAGVAWSTYLAARAGALRETIRRRLRAAERDTRISWEVVTAPEYLPEAIAAYEAVYASSWKEPEPYPAFNATLMREAAHDGTLRLGLLRIDGEPVAVQLWIVWQGTASVLKLAHDERHRAASPGTVLTALMIRRLLDEEFVQTLDFGRGDDPYKQGWARQRRQRHGVLLVNPMRRHGVGTLLRHVLGWLRRNIRRSPRPPAGEA